MPSNSEMYERGTLDATHDDLNTFYYQHYYYYRRGYDDARRQQRGGLLALIPARLVLLILAVLALAGAVAFWLLPPRSQPVSLTPEPTSAITAVGAIATSIVRPSPSPVATISPTAPPVLGVGRRARVVNVGDAPLRARANPGLDRLNKIVARFPQGAEVTITEGPQQADALTWWRIKGEAGEGWSAERSAEGLVFLEALP